MIKYAVEANSKGTAKIEDVSCFATFGWLLSEDQRNQAKDIMQAAQGLVSGPLEEPLPQTGEDEGKGEVCRRLVGSRRRRQSHGGLARIFVRSDSPLACVLSLDGVATHLG